MDDITPEEGGFQYVDMYALGKERLSAFLCDICHLFPGVFRKNIFPLLLPICKNPLKTCLFRLLSKIML